MRKVEASPIVNTVCALIFVAFVFLYLFCFQDDLLIYAQHVLSGGTTVYNPLVGSIIITTVLCLLSMLSSKLFTNNLYFIPAIYHLPSMLVLASLTDVRVGEQDGHVFGGAWIVAVILFIILLIVNRLVKGLPINASVTVADLLRELTLNLTIMLGMMTYVLISANTNEIEHVTLRDETLIKQRRFEDAALLAKPQYLLSRHLTTLHAFALGKTNGIGEHFFEYPVVGTSDDLFPTKDNKMFFMSEMPIYKFVGGVPSPGMSAKECLRLLYKRGKLKTDAHDYLYLACLLDRDIDGFVSYLVKDSVSVKDLPKHYREALVLYKHLRTAPAIDYTTPEMEADYEDFEALRKKNPDKILRENALRDSYANTYWLYYYSVK